MTDGAHQVGTLALVGGGEWLGGAELDRELLERGGGEVLVLPTAAAYEHPERAVESARRWYEALGATVRGVMVLTRSDAEDQRLAEEISNAGFIYLSGGSPLHLRSVLKDSIALDALVHAWRHGAVVAGSSAGAMVLSDPMVDPRGGAFTVGLGLVSNVAVVPHYTGEVTTQLKRTLSLTPSGCALIALGEGCAVVRESNGTWRRAGGALVDVFEDGVPSGLEALAGKPTR